jgi:hypothetical protein
MAMVTIVAMLAIVQFVYFGLKVGQARGKYGVNAPAVSGNEQFERHFRVHQNTLEDLMLLIPGLYAFGYYVSDLWGAALGVVFIAGRFLYENLYVKDPDKRAPGVLTSFIPALILVIGGLIGALLTIF